MKYCKDCLWFEYVDSPGLSKCSRPSNGISVLTGTVMRSYASTERNGWSIFGYCGSKAKYFEPRHEEKK